MNTTQHAEAEQLAEAFDLFEDWEDRYRFIIDLGKQLEPIDPTLKTEAHRVHGCQATVYMVPRIEKPAEGDAPIIHFLAEADAAIVNGLIAILTKIYSGQRASDILAFDIEGLLGRLGLEEHLSPTRRNGLHEMVKRIRATAQRADPSQA
ncbi:SufE family protein [Phycisphaerales bacterium AB-hyl4]|uniref:SufE family protein n=1 Tax=Natronomicrosphaera hydrolytica TaxID=3242702 RepID=A0ABV4U950_9BACT